MPGEDECTRMVQMAAMCENAGINLDKAGGVQGALRMYVDAEQQFKAAIACASPAHESDIGRLEAHRLQICQRINHLRTSNMPASIPVEHHIQPMTLDMQDSAQAHRSALETLGSCAAVGAGAGLILLGGPLAAIGGAAGAVYMACRGDQAGDIARAAGGVGLVGAERAKELNNTYKITDQLMVVGGQTIAAAKNAEDTYHITDQVTQAATATIAAARNAENTYHITENVTQAGAATVTAAREANETHHITEKVGTGLSKFAAGVGELDRQYQIRDKVAAGWSAGLGAIGRALSPRDTAVKVDR